MRRFLSVLFDVGVSRHDNLTILRTGGEQLRFTLDENDRSDLAKELREIADEIDPGADDE